MTESFTTQQPIRKFDLPRAYFTLFHPRRTFEEAKSDGRSTWLTPLLILTVTSVLVVLVTGYFKSRAAMMGEANLPPDWQWWTPEMQNNYMQAQQATQGPVFMYVMPLIGSLAGLWFGWFVYAGLLHLGSTLFGGRGSMQNSLNIVAWSSLPFALRDLLRIVFMVIVKHTITNPGLSGFVTNSAFLAKLVARVDIFLIWFIILLAIGLSVFDNLPRARSFMNVIIVVLFVMLVQAGLSAIVSRVGGAAIQRPFF